MKPAPIAAFLCASALASLAGAQEPAPADRASRSSSGGSSGNVLVFEDLLVEGTIETPNAFYILNRARLGADVLELRTSFLPQVVDSANDDPF